MDIDIDFPSSYNPLDYFNQIILASMVRDGELKKHNVGVYFQNIPVDNVTGLAAIPYQQAQELGYFKIDFLHLHILDNFHTKQEIRDLIKKEPDWILLQSPSVVSELFQIHNHYNLIAEIKPTSIEDLADCIALIRPSKRNLTNEYIKAKQQGTLESFRRILYAKPTDGRNYFKKAHAISYSLTIVLQLHLIKMNKP